MKILVIILLGFGLISGCNSSNNSKKSPKNPQKTINCPVPLNDLPLIKINSKKYGFYHAFNYQIEEIIPDTDTIAFKSYRHKFTLCRANNNWIVEEISPSESTNNLESGEYKNIQIEGKQYQYKVKLDLDSPREARQAIFELITPESSQPQQQIVYNLEQTKQARAGIELGEPQVSTPIVYDNRLFWSIFTYRAEGFGGIATIVSYNPATNKITVIQPPEIATQIINDLVITGNPDNPTFWIATQLTGYRVHTSHLEVLSKSQTSYSQRTLAILAQLSIISDY